MKFRSVVFAGALAMAGVVSADDVITGTTCAAMAVPAVGTYTLIAVPFKDVGTGTGTEAQKVKVADLVKTKGLKAGSKLYYYDGTRFYGWNLASDGGTWAGAAVTYSENGESKTTQTPDPDFQIPCGATLWLERAEGSEESVVLYGEEGTAVTPSLSAGTVQLISNPKATDYSFTAAGADGDMIMIPAANGTQTTYVYKTGDGKGWGQYSNSTTVGGVTINKFELVTPVIPGGRGAWYVSKGTVPSFNW